MNQPSETIGPIEKAARDALNLGKIMPPNNLIELETDYVIIRRVAEEAMQSATVNKPKKRQEDHPRKTVEKYLKETRQVIENLETAKQNRLALLKKQVAASQSTIPQEISPEEKVNEAIRNLKYTQSIIREKIHRELQSDPSIAEYTKRTAEKALQIIENLRIIKAMVAVLKKTRTQRLLKLERAAKKIAVKKQAKQKPAAPKQREEEKSSPPQKIYLTEETPPEEEAEIIEDDDSGKELDFG